MEYLVGIIIALLGAFFYVNTKRKSSEALLENNEVNKKLNEQDKEIAKDSGLLEAEAIKRKQLEEEMKKKGTNVTADELNRLLKNDQ